MVAMLVLAGCTALAAAAPLCDGPSTRWLQNDAGSHRDAGDTPGDALPLWVEGYAWSFLDLPAPAGPVDRDDWYVVDVPAGEREVLFGIIIAQQALLPAEVPYLPAPSYYLDVYPPGGPLTGMSSASGNVSFASHGAGRWLAHAYVQPPAPTPPCAGQAGSLAELPQEAQDYGVYFGCKPFCWST